MTGDQVRGDDLDTIAGRTLTLLAGPDAQLRDGQREALAALVQPGARVLVVQATGWGKSAVYWIATAYLRAHGAGPTLVVSPLLSLMRDQVAAAQRAGLRAATINSSNIDSWSEIESSVSAGELDVLLVSPERLANPTFGERVMQSLAGQLGLVVIDEAHSVSDWGHDFRPDYRRVAAVLGQLNPSSPVLATTATANARVVEDLASQLGQNTTTFRGPLGRGSLHLAVLPELSPLERFAWVVEQLPQLPGSGIVYVLTVADAERLAAVLQSRYGGDEALRVASYSGALPTDERERLEDALRTNQIKALVATSALGMGYDKPDVGFVVHIGAPPSPVSYYQQVGRAGRAVDSAVVAVLPSTSDSAVWDYFATATIPRREHVEGVLRILGQASGPMSVPALEAETGLRRTRIELLLKQLAVDGVVRRTTDGWSSTGVPWQFDEAHYEGVLATRRREADIMRDYIAGRECLMLLLARSLDDPAAQPCGRCSVCLGALPQPLRSGVEPETVAGIRRVLRGEQLILEPRKMWPGGAFGTRGRIPPALAADEGRVIVHASAPEWDELIRTELTNDGDAPAELLEAAVRILATWKDSWAQRPSVVVDLSVADTPRLTRSLADHLAQVGRMQRASFPPAASAPSQATSADEAAHWRNTLQFNDFEQIRDQCVLLVVDASSSGWPVTVAAATLREGGARHVLPLLIHRFV